MKYKLLCILLFCFLAVGYIVESKFTACLNNPSSVGVQAQTMAASTALTVVSSKTTIRPGDSGYITIQGKPGIRYKLKSSFGIGTRLMYVTQLRTTDANGMATFNWVAEPSSVPGTYSISITGGGETLNLSHTVTP
jgi:hypothetical protein